MKIQKAMKLFCGDPARGAEYFGGISKISVMFNNPREAAARARVAVKYARLASKGREAEDRK